MKTGHEKEKYALRRDNKLDNVYAAVQRNQLVNYLLIPRKSFISAREKIPSERVDEVNREINTEKGIKTNVVVEKFIYIKDQHVPKGNWINII